MKVHLTVTDAMHADPQVQDFIARTGAIVTRVEDTFEDIHTSQASLGAPLCVVLSVGINFVLPGGGALMTAASAVAATLIPRFVNGLMMHGDPFAVDVEGGHQRCRLVCVCEKFTDLTIENEKEKIKSV